MSSTYDNATCQNGTSVTATRTIIKLSVQRIADSCGWGVPLYEYQGERETYPRYVEQKGAEGIRKGQLEGNMISIEGMPALSAPSV